MRLRRPTWRGALVSAGVVVVTAGVTFGVLTLVGVTFQGEGQAQEGLGSQLTGDDLLTANRDHLAVCVDAVNVPGHATVTAMDLEPARKAVVAALGALAEDPSWSSGAFNRGPPPSVDLGCPQPGLAFEPGVEVFMASGRVNVDPVRVVKEASYYHTMVFLTPEGALAEKFGSATPLITEEYLREGRDVLIGVTIGVYLGPGQADDAAYVEKLVGNSLGIIVGTGP